MDTDVLPTLLVYRNGALVHNWVRVDLDAKQERGGIEDLLSRCKQVMLYVYPLRHLGRPRVLLLVASSASRRIG